MSDHFRALLRDRGLQTTAQRLAILEAVQAQPHATAVEIGTEARDRIGTISRQSVYDTLAVLADHEIIRRIQPAGSPPRFELRTGDNHHHLVCRQCDRVVDVDCATDFTPCLTPVDDGDFEIDEAEVVYWGVCPTCRSSRSADSNGRVPTTTHIH